ncbi:MAG: competence/damage-inducible protein A [Candidatus Marinimicrobia bacterium]|jgi:nicotinamide-nucleotide amidase|nr:competence/damage-inducible protein A [Candidatus Neomarinimicrobiota bacterium]MDP6594013.1 competence/damage-inducible protein A [Candidatus Neomarinimicrobiota bacterium]MDP6836849.1 competence/damage-inducible protein A [Candidatus Neomarinimicrobiota bacterium]|tara:strand:- start:4835 stop:6043 length:1209 start_codon:yes stop_codon:yes gene_type:complete
MKVAIITIGDEILGGFTLDSNATWMARKLMDIGIEINWKMSVGDTADDIKEALRIASEKSDVVLCTGGLGPTVDDITMKAFAEYISAELVFDEDYYERLKEIFDERGYEMPESNRGQAYVPDKGDIIPNPKGSARGVKYVANRTSYYVLPGVPSEMKAMMEKTILPEMKSTVKEDIKVTTLRTTGMMESALHDALKEELDGNDVRIGFLPGFTGVDIRLSSTDLDKVMELASAIYEKIGRYIYAEDWETLEEAVGRELREKGLTIAVAESCTGGLLGDRFTNVPGSSVYFLGGVVSYSNEAKMNLLGVQNDTLVEHGAVSEETAAEMAQGVRQLFQADTGISVTGISGPDGGTPEKPVGLTFIAIDYSGDVSVKRLMFLRDRRFNKELAAQTALNLVRLTVG